MSEDANPVFGSSSPSHIERSAHPTYTPPKTSPSSSTGEVNAVSYTTRTERTTDEIAITAADVTNQYSVVGNSYASSRTESTSNPPLNVPVLSPSSFQNATSWRSVADSPSVLGAPLERFLHTAQSQIQRTLSDQVTPVRLAGHLSVLMVAAVILVMSQVEVPDWDISLRAFPTASLGDGMLSSRGAVTQVSQMLAGESLESPFSGDASLQRAIVPFTIIPEEPQEEIQQYVVQPGDTVLAISQKFGLKPESVQWANSGLEMNPDLLRVGDVLNILPLDGALHTVQPGDTLSSLAAKYKVDIEEITAYPSNSLGDPAAALVIGSQIIIPGGIKPYVPPQVFAYNASAPASATKGTGAFVWPTSGSVTQRFWSGHPAIDIGSWTGAPVKAADSGHVIVAQTGYNNGYGNHVMIDHGNGFVSLYAHMNSFYVRVGENISRGQQIGTVGNTGNSTGPHLHLEIRYQDVPRNPFSYLN